MRSVVAENMKKMVRDAELELLSKLADEALWERTSRIAEGFKEEGPDKQEERFNDLVELVNDAAKLGYDLGHAHGKVV